MKLKVKLPLLSLAIFLLIVIPGIIYTRSSIITGKSVKIKFLDRSIRVEMIFALLIMMGLVFIILTVYLHFDITKPLLLLNARIKNMAVTHPLLPVDSRRRDEIGELYRHFNEMEARLHEAHKEQIDMIAAISHDLKTPLTAINGFVELLQIQPDISEKERQEYYELISKKTKHITELINAFSLFAKNELELETFSGQPVAIHHFFENIALEYETELSGLNFELVWHHSFSSNQTLMMNEAMMRRVFGNLFSNAVRYAGRTDLKIFLNGSVKGNDIVLTVEDNGNGVPSEDLSSLFLKFFTVDKSRQKSSGGMGLGLASCKSIVERHNGRIHAFHSSHGGLGIEILLPLLT